MFFFFPSKRLTALNSEPAGKPSAREESDQSPSLWFKTEPLLRSKVVVTGSSSQEFAQKGQREVDASEGSKLGTAYLLTQSILPSAL